MEIILKTLEKSEVKEFKEEMQKSFQLGAEAKFGEIDKEILPEKDIDRSLEAKGSIAYVATLNGEMVGGAIVVIDEKAKHNHLDFLFVKNGVQSKGIGKTIWQKIEKMHPKTKVWETCTPYFEKRNIHFYINCCGFSAVEFFNPQHPDPHECGKPEVDSEDDGCMFRFEKIMN